MMFWLHICRFFLMFRPRRLPQISSNFKWVIILMHQIHHLFAQSFQNDICFTTWMPCFRHLLMAPDICGTQQSNQEPSWIINRTLSIIKEGNRPKELEDSFLRSTVPVMRCLMVILGFCVSCRVFKTPLKMHQSEATEGAGEWMP